MQQATQINEGYQTLKDPLRRGRYLLELGGYQFDDEHRTTSDAAFLMEQMELRELLSEVREAEDAFAALGKIMDRIDGQVMFPKDSFHGVILQVLYIPSGDSPESR